MARGQASRKKVEIEGRELSLSNLDKVLYPAAGFRKADVIDYYRRIAPWVLPHLAQRPPTLVRAPDGPDGPRFFEKNCPSHRPDWVDTAPGNEATGGTKGCLVEELPALVWLANLAALELHTHQWTLADPAHPTAMVIDLDPGPPATNIDSCRVALALRETLARLELQCVIKTSGGKGLHLSVPIHGSGATDEETKRFALALGQLLESRDPDRVLVDMTRSKRPGKVFIDWSQNDRHKTTVCAYSLRLRDRPTVSTPLAWPEVEAALEAGDVDALTFEAEAVVARVGEHGDLYADSLTLQQDLPAL
ncbi:MAG: bifunctional non-ous end joining protein LigD [Actinomycetota bacterium]|nr:bifunctional non-ous end joining protein LigD [Actinomycetota bacterium]